MWTLKVTFLSRDFYFQLRVFMSAVICMLRIDRVARPLRPCGGFSCWNPSPLSVTGNGFAALSQLSGHQLAFRIGATWSRFAARERRNDKVMTASVLCAAVLTLHHRYQIVCVAKCVSKIPQADESESCQLWREFQEVTPGRSDGSRWARV